MLDTSIDDNYLEYPIQLSCAANRAGMYLLTTYTAQLETIKLQKKARMR